MDQTTNIKPGYTTTEFWVTIIPNVFAALTLVFHTTFGVNVQVVSGAAAAIGNLVYSFSRSRIKSAAQLSNRTITTQTGTAPSATVELTAPPAV